MSSGATCSRDEDPHRGCPLLSAGLAPEEADTTLLLLHGRGATAANILDLYHELGLKHTAALAPQAAGHSWYPQSFLAPLHLNQPFLDSALARIVEILADLALRRISADRIALLGFSQGACLALEFAARNPARYAAVIGLSGGLIGPPGPLREYKGSLQGTPVFLGAADPDPHVPFTRVVETQAVLTRMAAEVRIARYPGAAHTVNEDELEICRAMLKVHNPAN